MDLRKATVSDLAGILELFRETIIEVNKKDYSPEQLQVWMAGANDIERWQNKIRDQYFLIAEERSKIIGFASITPEGYLDTLFVHKDRQGEGIAGLLIRSLLEFAKDQQITEITTDASITARPFFEKVGFRVIRKQEINKKGISIANYKMRVSLKEGE